MKEWDDYMTGFVPEDMLTIDLRDRTEFILYEDIKKEGVYIRGAYFVQKSDDDNRFIDFYIYDPNDRIIFVDKKKEEGLFRFNTTKVGTYQFVFNNKKWFGNKDLTIAIHKQGDEKEEGAIDSVETEQEVLEQKDTENIN